MAFVAKPFSLFRSGRRIEIYDYVGALYTTTFVAKPFPFLGIEKSCRVMPSLE